MTGKAAYGTQEWEELYFKARRPGKKDFKTLKDIIRNYPDGDFWMVQTKDTKKYFNGETIGEAKWSHSLKAALTFNGVFRTEKDAKEWYSSKLQKNPDLAKEGEVQMIKKNVSDIDVNDIVIEGARKNRSFWI